MRNLRGLARIGLALGMLCVMCIASAYAQAPTAGTVIGNQAIATYQNAIGDTVQVTSNLVETTVNQVAGVTIVADTSKSGALGGKVFFPHTITNEGNGSDTFNLTAVDANTGTLALSGITIYPDADLDGVPDSLTPITVTPAMAAGEVYGIVVEVTMPASGTAGDTETMTVTATSAFDGSVTDSVTDTLTLTGEPIIDLTKQMTPATVSPGDTVTIQLSYQNNGLTDATTVTITDALPAGMTYVAGSGVWSDAAGALGDAAAGVDATNGVGNTITYDFGVTAADTVTAVIDSIPAGRSATLTFQATVDSGVSGTLNNTASFTVSNGPDGDSNQAVITVAPSIAVTLADSSASAQDVLDGVTTSSNDDDTENDVVLRSTGTFAQGATIPFEFVVTNHSNVSETFNLTAANTSFPAGTLFSITTAGGVPLTDSDGDGNPDITLASGGTGVFTLQVDLPDTAAATRAAADPAWDAVVTATASSDTSVTNTSTARLTAEVVGATVDLENAGGLADGPNVGDGAPTNPWTTNTTDPGTTTNFTLVVQNTGTTASSYDLQWSGSNFAASTGLACRLAGSLPQREQRRGVEHRSDSGRRAGNFHR